MVVEPLHELPVALPIRLQRRQLFAARREQHEQRRELADLAARARVLPERAAQRLEVGGVGVVVDEDVPQAAFVVGPHTVDAGKPGRSGLQRPADRFVALLPPLRNALSRVALGLGEDAGVALRAHDHG